MVRPKSNLPPEAQPWGRAIEDELDTLSRAVESGALSVLNNNKAVNGTLAQIAEQISAINEVQAGLVATNAALAAQIATLTAQQAQITSLISQQVDGSTGTNSGSVSLNTTPTAYAGINFTVPSGYTQARVMVVSAMYMGGTVASIIRSRINGTSGPDMYAFTNAAYANATASSAASLSGLSGGGTVTVDSLANTSTGSTSGYIITSAIVTWLK